MTTSDAIETLKKHAVTPDMKEAVERIEEALSPLIDGCAGCRYDVGGMLFLPCEGCMRSAWDNYESESENEED